MEATSSAYFGGASSAHTHSIPENMENLTRWLSPGIGADIPVLDRCLDLSSTRLESGCSPAGPIDIGLPSTNNGSSKSKSNVRKYSSSNGVQKISQNSNGNSSGAHQSNGNILSPSSCTSSPLANGQSASILNNLFTGTPFRRKSSLSAKPPPRIPQESTSLGTVLSVLFGGISLSMAAIGITSGADWLAWLVITAQLGAIFLILLSIYYYRAFYIVYKTIFRDIKGGYRYAKILISVTLAQRGNATVQTLFAKNVKKHPNKVCFYFEEEVWTFKQVEDMSNQIGNYYSKQGFKKGDTISLFMENRPQYVCLWLGLCKIGVVPALINFNLRVQPLKHSIEVAKSKALIYGHELAPAVQEILNMGGMDELPLFCSGHAAGDTLLKGAIDLDYGLKVAPSSVPVPSEPINFTDKLLYIFTSGTTGLPKAAVIKHSRFCFFTMGIHNFVGVSKNEVIYDPLPMYHTAGGMLGVGQALLHGCTAVLRRKFSAKAYWTDCARYNCTAAQYIGEICRYLLIQPPAPTDKQHNIRLMFGNGLRPQIWSEFAKRFNIKIISEFYGATEGNCNIININNHVGAVGFISRIMPFIYPVTLIKVDELTGEPIRDHRTGLVVRCKPNEDGELVGRIVENHPVREFQGYADSTATTKKIVRDVFSKGDAAFRTGDILMMDEFGYFFFKDRTGDTYRWKGENVSTSEVEAVVSNACGLKDAVVYGVEVPGSEGRAGMAAILDPEESLDLSTFAEVTSKSLPVYARPIFIRIVKQMDMTGTYKMKKLDLQKEGFDVTKVSDKIYCLLSGKYVLVDNELYSKLMGGQMRI